MVVVDHLPPFGGCIGRSGVVKRRLLSVGFLRLRNRRVSRAPCVSLSASLLLSLHFSVAVSRICFSCIVALFCLRVCGIHVLTLLALLLLPAQSAGANHLLSSAAIDRALRK